MLSAFGPANKLSTGNAAILDASRRLTNFSLRGLTMASRLLLLFLLARLLEPAEVGLYGLVAASIGYGLYLVGLDFYIYTTRELIKADKSQWGCLLKSQCGLLGILYVIFLPVLALLFLLGPLPWHVAPLFYLLLFLEHLNQELSRLLVAMSRPLMASFVLFLRSGLWIFALVPTLLVREDSRSISTVLLFWSLGGASAAVVGLASLQRMAFGGWHRAIDWRWIGRGLRVALPFLLATLALRGVFTADRFWFEALADMEVLAAYVLFIGVAGALVSFLDAGVFVFQYPSLVRWWNGQSPADFRRESRTLLVQTFMVSFVFAALALVMMPKLLTWLDREVYTQHVSMFPYLMSAMVLYALSMIPHYILYAQGHDRPIFYSHLFLLICFMAATWLISLWDGYTAVPLALCLSFAVMLIWKTYACLKLTPSDYGLGSRED